MVRKVLGVVFKVDNGLSDLNVLPLYVRQRANYYFTNASPQQVWCEENKGGILIRGVTGEWFKGAEEGCARKNSVLKEGETGWYPLEWFHLVGATLKYKRPQSRLSNTARWQLKLILTVTRAHFIYDTYCR